MIKEGVGMTKEGTGMTRRGRNAGAIKEQPQDDKGIRNKTKNRTNVRFF
jgi:hypothetical protein